MLYITIDIGGTAIKSALSDEHGNLSQQKETPSNGKDGKDKVLERVSNIIQNYGDCDAIGISTAGQIDYSDGSILFGNDNIKGYSGTKLTAIIEEKFKKPVFVENDVCAACIGEGSFGGANGIQNYLCLTYGTGIGGAVVINGQLFRGKNGVAGEFGHIITHFDGLTCGCGGNGCYEMYGSVTALVEAGRAYSDSIKTGRDLFEKYKQGDTHIESIVDRWLDEIVCGLVTLIHSFDPDCVILGGGVMSLDFLIDKINSKLDNAVITTYKGIQVKKAELGNNAGMLGMVHICNEKMDVI